MAITDYSKKAYENDRKKYETIFETLSQKKTFRSISLDKSNQLTEKFALWAFFDRLFGGTEYTKKLDEATKNFIEYGLEKKWIQLDQDSKPKIGQIASRAGLIAKKDHTPKISQYTSVEYFYNALEYEMIAKSFSLDSSASQPQQQAPKLENAVAQPIASPVVQSQQHKEEEKYAKILKKLPPEEVDEWTKALDALDPKDHDVVMGEFVEGPRPIKKPVKPGQEQLDQEWARQGFQKCRSGVLPPFALRSMRVSMKPPTMDPKDFPRYSSAPIPEPERSPAISVELQKMSPKEQIDWFMAEIEKSNRTTADIFEKNKQAYDSVIASLPPKSEDELRKLTDFVAHFSALAAQIDPRHTIEMHFLAIKQTAQKHGNQFDANVHEVQKNLIDANLRYKCFVEAANYLQSYLGWIEDQSKPQLPKAEPPRPLKLTDEFRIFKTSDLMKAEHSHNLNIHLKNGILTFTPKDYQALQIYKYSSNYWEPVSLHLKTVEGDDRYLLKFATEPNTKYRIDIGTIQRKSPTETQFDYNDTFFIQTDAMK